MALSIQREFASESMAITRKKSQATARAAIIPAHRF
jgi:hypothetical protein